MLLVLLVKEQDDMYGFAMYYSTNRAILVVEHVWELFKRGGEISC